MRYIYNPKQFKAAVKFVAKKNRFFHEDIFKLDSILIRLINDAIKDYERRDKIVWVATAGFMVMISEAYEDTAQIEILVDPAVSKGYNEEDWDV